MSLDKQDLELFERVVYKNADDIATAIARSFERLEDRIDAMEGRLYSRMSELDDRIENCRQELTDKLDSKMDSVPE